jgi:hypothetical protein
VTMSTDDVVDLLSAITAYDNRNASAANVLAWAKAAELGRWTLPEALDAVHAHFAESTDFLMPAHITTRVKATRQDRALRQQQAELEAAPVDPAAAARIQQVIGELAQQMGWSEEHQDRAGFALRVACPHCGSAVGVRCTSRSSGKPLKESACHPSRADVLAQQLKGAS